MNKICFIFILFSTWALGQSSIEFFQAEIYRGCKEVKKKQNAVPTEELIRLKREMESIVEENFSRAFKENPKIKIALARELTKVTEDPYCQNDGNNCRARLLGTALFYYQSLRPDIPDCQNYVRVPQGSPRFNSQCELEVKYRKSNLQSVQESYGVPGPATYKKELVAIKDNTSLMLANIILYRDRVDTHICSDINSASNYRPLLNLNSAGEYQEGIDPDLDLSTILPSECIEDKEVLLNEFLPLNFDSERSTVGQDQIVPVKEKILTFISSHPNLVISSVEVTSSSSKTPFYITVGGKKKIDPNSDARNISLAQERAIFVKKVLEEKKTQSSQLSKIDFKVNAKLAGPNFSAVDLNDRFVTRMSPGYIERIEAMYKQNQALFQEEALIESSLDLLSEQDYSNLYQAKFKPFHGFKITIQGHNKENLKCISPKVNSSSGKATKQ